MRSIATYLNSQKQLSAWQVKKIRKESNEIYAIGQKPETLRCNQTVDYSVLLHTKAPTKGHIGESKCSFQVLPGQWRPLIDDSIERAGLVENPAYELTDKWQLQIKNNAVCDEKIVQNGDQLIYELTEGLQKLNSQTLGNCELASHEVFLESYELSLQNHLGLELVAPSTKIVFDFVLLSDDRQLENNVLLKRRFIDDFDYQSIIAEEAENLSLLKEAKLPETSDVPVILTGEALDTLFEYFITQANAQASYYGYSSFKKGESVYPEGSVAREPLNLSTDPMRRGALGAGFFDELGFPLKKVEMIKEGNLNEFATDGKMANLLGWPRTSKFSTVVVESGKESLESLRTDGVLELSRFSTFHPNGITGSFSGEIRLGFLHKNGKKIPVKGGSVSGITQQAFLNCTMSSETAVRENYSGPAAILFDKLTIAGA